MSVANDVCDVVLTMQPLARANEDVDLTSGAVVEFRGVVRAIEDGKEISGIEYEAHVPMAEHQLRMLAEDAAQQFRLTKVILHHRVGFVAAGEASLVLRATSPHRAAAFEASKWMVDELKRKLPIWKRPVYLKTVSVK